MEIKILSRSPQKVVTLFFFLLAMSVTSMLLLLQTYVDGVGLAYAEQYYSYIGTIRQSYAELPDVQSLPEDVIAELASSGCISEEDRRVTCIGRIAGFKSVPDIFLSYDLADYCVFLGTVADNPSIRQNPIYYEETASVRVEHLYAGNADLERYDGKLLLAVSRPLDSEPVLQQGMRYLFICRFAHNGVRAVTSAVAAFAEPPSEIWPGNEAFDEMLSGGVMPLSADQSLEQAISAGQVLLAERGLNDTITAMNGLSDRVSLRGTGNMEMLIPITDRTMFYTEGRGIRPDDAGQQVCVMSAYFAMENGLSVGDTVELFASDGVYISAVRSGRAGIESGFPFSKDVSQELTRTEISLGEFTVIGLYAFVERNLFESYYLFSYNDIFVPLTAIPKDISEEARPYSYSFRVQGKDYDRFLDCVEVPLMEQGYVLHMSDSDWPSVQSVYAQMNGRYRLSLMGAGVAFILVLCVYNVLLVMLFRREFALRRLLGTPMDLARRSFTAPFLITAIPAYAAAIVLCYFRGAATLPERLTEIAPDQAPGSTDIISMLGMTAAVCLLVSYVILRLLILRERQKSLQRLLT